MTPNNHAESIAREGLRERPDLDQQYRNIGISAVAAALRYQTAAQNPADAAVKMHDSENSKAAA